jgi:hypothetical protein
MNRRAFLKSLSVGTVALALPAHLIGEEKSRKPGSPFMMVVSHYDSSTHRLREAPELIKHEGRTLGQFEEVYRVSRLPEFRCASENPFASAAFNRPDEPDGPLRFHYLNKDGWHCMRWVTEDGKTEHLATVRWMPEAEALSLGVGYTNSGVVDGKVQVSRCSCAGVIKIT